MKSASVLAGVVGLLWAGPGRAEQSFPLELKTLTLEAAQRRAGGYGGYGMFWTRAPDQVKKAPAFKSAHPLYATIGEEAEGQTVPPVLVFALDESNGTGKGYDRLIADLNGNGDLTDDTALERLTSSTQTGPRNEFASFGPGELPADRAVGPWRPRFFAEVFLYNRQAIKSSDRSRLHPIGQLRVQAANHLEAQVEVNGVKQRFGLLDGNCNFRLGEPGRLVKYQRSGNDEGSWYLRTADYFLRDVDDSGDYERKVGQEEAEVFGPLVYFGTKPYRVTVASDLKSIRFEPYAGAVGELRVQAEVSDLVLARQAETDHWDVVTPEVRAGKAVLPEGIYRLATSALCSDMKVQPWVRMSSSRPSEATFRVSSAEPAILRYGLPLRLEVTTRRERGQQALANPDDGLWARFRNWLSGLGEPDDFLRLNVNVLGTGNEPYSGFFGSEGQMKPPRFEIADLTGKQVASGKFEFG